MAAGSFLDERESQRFVGRSRELALIDRLLDGSGPPLLYLHGAGGTGKSALLREAARRARRQGVMIRRIEGRDPRRAEEELDAALQAQHQPGPPVLLLLDTYEAAPALGPPLRDGLPAALEGGTRMLIASRRPPEPAWRHGGWSQAMLIARVDRLSMGECDAFLVRAGVDDPAARVPILAWADGSPLALSVAAEAIAAGQALELDQLERSDLLATTLLEHLIDDDLEGANRDVLAIAALARRVDARMLADVLPGVDGDHAELWLRQCSFSEQLGTAITVHDHIRRAVRATLHATDPGRAAELRRRIADHLHRRGLAGEPRLLVEMAELIDDPAMRWMLSPPAGTLRTGQPHPADAQEIGERLTAPDRPLWPELQRWFTDAPNTVVVVREDGPALGFMVLVQPERAPAWTAEDPLFGGWLPEARRLAAHGAVLFLRGSRVLEPVGDEAFQSAVIGTGNHYVASHAELSGVRYVFGAADAGDARLLQGLEAIGYRRAPQLDADCSGRQLAGFIHDYGPGGVIGWGRDLVYRSIGLPPPTELFAGDVDERAVRDALRAFHDSAVLATSPLARGTTTHQRAESVRAQLLGATEAAFGTSRDERLQAEVLRLGYLAGGGSHASAMHELHLSRTTYFRRLAAASTRIAEHLLA